MLLLLPAVFLAFSWDYRYIKWLKITKQTNTNPLDLLLITVMLNFSPGVSVNSNPVAIKTIMPFFLLQMALFHFQGSSSLSSRVGKPPWWAPFHRSGCEMELSLEAQALNDLLDVEGTVSGRKGIWSHVLPTMLVTAPASPSTTRPSLSPKPHLLRGTKCPGPQGILQSPCLRKRFTGAITEAGF